jgi:hypothetical protein
MMLGLIVPDESPARMFLVCNAAGDAPAGTSICLVAKNGRLRANAVWTL